MVETLDALKLNTYLYYIKVNFFKSCICDEEIVHWQPKIKIHRSLIILEKFNNYRSFAVTAA